MPHQYATGGAYVVTLTVTDAAGQSLVLKRYLKIHQPPICGPFTVVGFTAAPDDGQCAVPMDYGPSNSVYRLKGGVTVNGVDFRNDQYHQGDPVYIDAGNGSIYSFVQGEATGLSARFGSVDIADRPVFSLQHSGNSLDLALDPLLAYIDKNLPKPTRSLGGLPLVGGDLVLREDGATTLENAQVVLPKPFASSVAAPTVTGEIAAHPAQAEYSLPPIPDISFGGLELGDVAFEHHADGSWTGALRFVLPGSGASFLAEPPKPGGIGLTPSGGFDYAGGKLTFPPNAVPIGPDVFYLDYIDFGVGRFPTYFQGQVGLTTPFKLPFTDVPLAQIHGCLAVVFGTDAEQGQQAPFCGQTYTDQGAEQALRVTGALKVVGVDFANGTLEYHYPSNLLSVSGSINYDVGGLDLFHIAGDVGLNFASLGQWAALAHLQVTETIIGNETIGKAGVLLSSRGIAGCVNVLGVSAGGWYKWSGAYHFGVFACDVDNSPVALSSSATGRPANVVHLRSGPPFVLLELRGNNASPRITATGPGGRMLRDNGQSVQHFRRAEIIHSESLHTTYLRIEHPRDGIWQIGTQPGSPAIASIVRQNGLPQVWVKGRIGRRGTRRLLHYRVRVLSDQRVTFIEQGSGAAHILGKAHGAAGTLAFDPAAGPAGRRQLFALVERSGVPRANLQVAVYSVTAPARLPRVTRLTARTRGGALLISWAPLRGATHYLLDLRLGDGRVLRIETKPGAHRLRISRYSPGFGARIVVTAIDHRGRSGRAAPMTVRPRHLKRAIVVA